MHAVEEYLIGISAHLIFASTPMLRCNCLYPGGIMYSTLNGLKIT